MNLINGNTLNRIISFLLLLAIAGPLALSLAIPRAAKAVEDFGRVGVPDGPDTLPETEQPLAGPGSDGGSPGAGGTFAALGCTATAAGAVGAAIPTIVTGLPTSDIATKIGTLATAGGTLLNCVGSFLNLIKSTVSASGISALVAKMKLDYVATGIMKVAIKTLRDMVIRWMATGRFESPVFSTSFSVDAAKIAENASRIFLSKLTAIDFCAGFDIPGRPALSFDLALGLECTLPSKLNSRSATIDFYLHPEEFSAAEYALATSKENLYPHVLARTLERKAEAEARAVTAFAAEFAAGQGFLPIKDPKTGKTITPGTAVGETVKVSQVVAPILGSELADDVQTAVVDIIDAAVRIMIEKGLTAAFPRT